MNQTAVAEDQNLDRRSLRMVRGATANFPELAKACVCFANGSGGRLLVGIEDDEHPPAGQRIDLSLLDSIRQRVRESTVNVQIEPELCQDENGGEFIVINIQRSTGIASTVDGRYFLRIGDTCKPVVGDEVMRLAGERPIVPWEDLTSNHVRRSDADASKLSGWTTRIRESDRVKSSVKEKTEDELLEHYGLAHGEELTNLGVLLVGTTAERRKLGTAPIVQIIKYDARGEKVQKHVYDEHNLSPVEMVDAIWKHIPDFRESYEISVGLFRESVPAFEESVVRELLVNALVHRPYTQRGDIFLNLHPDHLEIVNPGRFPIGVTPQNVLHSSRRRNDGLARVFHDLKLMEREGSGFELMYDRLLASGRAAPVASEGDDSVHVVVPRLVDHPGVIQLIRSAEKMHRLSQRERIALGMLARTEGLAAVDLAKRLYLPNVEALTPLLARLIDYGFVKRFGRTKAVHYIVPPVLLSGAGLENQTSLKRIEPQRLRALIIEDVLRYPRSSSSDIRCRIGLEIPERTFRRVLRDLTKAGQLVAEGERRWRRYSAGEAIGQGRVGGQ